LGFFKPSGKKFQNVWGLFVSFGPSNGSGKFVWKGLIEVFKGRNQGKGLSLKLVSLVWEEWKWVGKEVCKTPSLGRTN